VSFSAFRSQKFQLLFTNNRYVAMCNLSSGPQNHCVSH